MRNSLRRRNDRLKIPWIMITSAWLTLACGVRAEDRLASRAAELLVRRCLECHSGDDPQGKLDLSSRMALHHGGEGGSAIDDNDSIRSRLWERVASDEMPPKKPLDAAEKRLLQDWLAAGTPYEIDPLSPWEFTTPERAGKDWWSLQPLRSVIPPLPLDPSAALSPIDAFHQHDLQVVGLAASPAIERRLLIRRLSFDLVGLPPAPDEIDEFCLDNAPDAGERLTDRLLASPHYGERWARHWLDVVRFGESNGFERDLPRPHAWHYRDWVIEAFNADLPYADFVRRQIAGSPTDRNDFSSTGFLVAGPHDTVIPASENMRKSMRFDELEELLGTIGQTFLGLTINCARCHDHKFDPIWQREYYQLTAVMAGVEHGERETLPFGQEIADATAPGARKVYTAIVSQPGPTALLRRGNVTDPGEIVMPASLSALPAGAGAFQLPVESAEQDRRTALAGWLTANDNALATRTIVNRVWHYHFGGGFIDSPNDLGFNGGRPTHPEMFEWLCHEFQRTGGSLKQFHRQLVNPAIYRQSSSPRQDALKVDAGNRMLWRMSPRRLEAEAVRDAMLAVSGELNETLGGASYQDFHSYFFKGTQFYEPVDADNADVHRRTLYRMWARGGRSPFLDTFDCPDPSTTTPKRSMTTTPLQALALLNNAFALRMAERLADRAQREGAANSQAKIMVVYRLAYGREPQRNEIVSAQEFIERRGLVSFCRVILNSSEFLYVE